MVSRLGIFGARYQNACIAHREAPDSENKWKMKLNGSEVLGFLVWILIAGTEYFLYPVFGWIMFVAVFYWILTLFFLIIYMTMAYTRIPQVPWTTVGLCFNGSALLLYLIAAISEACAVTKELDNHSYNSWAASSFFAFVVTSCYGGNTYFSFVSWRSRTLQ
ncbi:CKLF-like MARVEL transmembrane domain-containing protein 8 [Python bivittatus]|uniref:CKLF-like MARVEL transmembrane domain-containing protein 8 n=1 Tax=Python bivittatus TaxID=176946 RepID=A0A9F2NGN0_PYTBI|nr:CKLF-like MARVEL transmembrane domain-containing protein 8 [Python bivittatus]